MPKPNQQSPTLSLPLRPGAHEAKDLVAWITQNSKRRGSGLDDHQRNALKAYSRFPARQRPKEEFLRELFVIFDDLFFFGSLKNQCIVEYPRKKIGQGPVGVAHNSLTTRKPIIKIYKYEPSTRYSDNYWEYASTLLHEMIHAFLMRYVRFSGTRKMFPVTTKCLQIEGRSGHGFAWQDIAYALEVAANDPRLAGMRLGLSRLDALRQELKLWYKPVVDLARWGFDPVDRWPDSSCFLCKVVEDPVKAAQIFG
jgi:hypothetical protein